MLLHTSCNSIYNPLMFLIGDCCGCARVASDPDLIQSKCLRWEWRHAWESLMRIWLQVDNHRSQCSGSVQCMCVHVLHELQDIHTVLAIHQPHNLACQGPKCVVAGSTENILLKLGKLYSYLILFVKVIVKHSHMKNVPPRPPPLTETVSWRSFVELQTRHEPCEVRVRWPPPILLSWSSGHWHFCLHFPAVMQFYIVLYCILYWHENGRNGSRCLISPKSSLDLQLASSLVTFLFDW